MSKTNRRASFPEETPPDALPSLPRNSSVGKKWRFRRDTVIYVAHRNGISQRALADVFDLPRSRVSRIVQKFRQHALKSQGADGLT